MEINKKEIGDVELFNIRFTYGDDEDTIDDLIIDIIEEKDSAIDVTLRYVMTYFEIGGNSYPFLGYIFYSLPSFLEQIISNTSTKLFIGGCRGKLICDFVEGTSDLHVTLLFDREVKGECTMPKEDFLAPFLRELDIFFAHFEKNVPETICPISYKYIAEFKQKLDVLRRSDINE
jgi:hypothetical protein